MPFKKGFDPNRANGGKREGSGRPQEWLKAKCRQIVDSRKLISLLADIAEGKAVQRVQLPNGTVSETMISADVKDRLKATEMLLDRGFGKPVQEVVGEDGGPLTVKIVSYTCQK